MVIFKLAMIVLYTKIDSDEFQKALISINNSTYFIPLAFGALCLLISGIMLINKSKKLTAKEHNKFKEEVDWFWSLLCLIAISIMSWVTYHVFSSPDVFPSLTLRVLFKLLHHSDAIIIFVMFILRKNVKKLLFNKHGDHQKTIPTI